MGDTCGTCRFFQDGFCRRYPPTIVQGAFGAFTSWPDVDRDNWCGEWQDGLGAARNG